MTKNRSLHGQLAKHLASTMFTDHLENTLRAMIECEQRNNKGMSIRECEDLVIQKIIKKYDDHTLDYLWFRFQMESKDNSLQNLINPQKKAI